MEKENMKKTSVDKERKKKLTNAILMAFVCILMMSGATYAWFTMSNTAKVQSMKLNVAAEGKLYISNEETDFTAEKYKVDHADWPNMDKAKTLYPCTTSDGKTMYKPVYTASDNVGSATAVDTGNTTEKDMYYLEHTFYLYMDEGDNDSDTNKTYDVCLEKGDLANSEGTYFIKSTEQSDKNGIYCVRVSFEVADLTNQNASQAVHVYEPNSNGSVENGTRATTSNGAENINPITNTYKQNTNGQFLKGNDVTTTGDSETLFQIKGDTPTAVVIRVWFEGEDPDCCDEIAMQQIEGQLKFKASKVIESAQ